MNNKSIISVILGIVSLIFFSWIIVCAAFGMLAIFLGIKSIKSEEKRKANKIGIILGSISLIYIILFLIIKFSISFSPMIIYDSCSMYHESDFNTWWENNKEFYEENQITESEFNNFPIKNGFNKGDVIFLWKKESYAIGEVILVNPNEESLAKNPIMHRIVSMNPVETKGDNNLQQLNVENNMQKIDETNIQNERILGKALFRIPYYGFTKLVFFEMINKGQRGICQ